MSDDKNSIIQLEDGCNRLKKYFDDYLVKKRKPEPKDYTYVYATCYDMCSQRSPHNWSSDVYTIHGKVLHDYLRNTALPALCERTGSDLLNQLAYHWSNYETLAKGWKKVFIYLDRYYVKKKGLPSLGQVGITTFKTQVYDHIKGDATTAIASLIGNEREGDQIDTNLVKRIVEIYEKMGIYETFHQEHTERWIATRAESLNSYTDDLENFLIQDVQKYYKGKASPDIDKELARVAAYLNPVTGPKIRMIMNVLSHEARPEIEAAIDDVMVKKTGITNADWSIHKFIW